jgi:hypothetical protein
MAVRNSVASTFDPLSVEGAALDHAVGPILDAEEVQRRIRIVPPGS